ncbi:hypothetical protein TELCIR_10066, partial [Teladorsagia circumcincta]
TKEEALRRQMCSTFILTALAFDRYMAICHPEYKRMCSTFILTALAFDRYMAICHPEYKREKFNVVKYMCVDGMRRDVKLLVVGFLVVFAFVLPCSLLTFFYAKIILRLRHQQRTMLQSRIPIRRITIYTLAATLFYLSCQIPFWVPQIYGIVCMVFGYKINPSYITLTYYSHLLPFVSASFNWIFYARLNSQFKKGLVLVTERMIRRRTRSIQNSTLRDRDVDDLALVLMPRPDDAVTMCPSCEGSPDAFLITAPRRRSQENAENDPLHEFFVEFQQETLAALIHSLLFVDAVDPYLKSDNYTSHTYLEADLGHQLESLLLQNTPNRRPRYLSALDDIVAGR